MRYGFDRGARPAITACTSLKIVRRPMARPTRAAALGSMGAINVFSFCQDKILTTGGEGGLV